MGLMQIARHLKKIDDFKEIFEEVFGMSVEEAKARLQKPVEEVKKVEISDEEKKSIEQRNEKVTSPEELVKAFSEDIEEFYPNGKPQH